MDIERRYHSTTVTIASGAALSEAIDMRPFAGGVLYMPAAWTAASLAFKHSATLDGTYQPLKDDSGALVEMTVAASGDFVLPDKVFGAAFIKVWSETSSSDVNQDAARSITVSLKG